MTKTFHCLQPSPIHHEMESGSSVIGWLLRLASAQHQAPPDGVHHGTTCQYGGARFSWR